MSICPRCGEDNWSDYPVCSKCATVAHFEYRAICVHCVRKQAVTQQREEIVALLKELVNLRNSANRNAACFCFTLGVGELAGRAAELLATMEEGK
jgi:hypothetical protein